MQISPYDKQSVLPCITDFWTTSE